MRSPSSLISTIIVVSRYLSIAGFFLSGLTLVGWFLEIDRLKRLISNSPMINPVESILFMLSSFAVFIIVRRGYSKRIKRLSQGIAVLVGIVGFEALIETLADFDFHIGELLFYDQLYDERRQELTLIAPNAAFNFILLSFAIYFVDYHKSRRPAEPFCIAITLISFLSFYGYVYGVTYLYGIASFIPMSFIATLLFLMMSLSVLFCRPYKGSMALLIGESPGEIIFWRFLALFLPLIFGYIRLAGEKNNIFSAQFGAALTALFSYSIAMFLLGRKAVVKHRLKKEKRKTQRTMKEDARRLKSIFNNSTTVMYIKDKEDRFALVNNQFQKVYGLRKDEVYGKSIAEVNAQRDDLELPDKDQEVILKGVSTSTEERVKVGEKVYTFVTVRFPLIDLSGKIYAECSISTDISKQKAYELEIIEEKKKLKAIVDNAGQGILLIDPNGDIDLFNDKAAKIAGVTKPLEVVLREYQVYYPDTEEPIPWDQRPAARCLRGEKVDDMELVIKNPNYDEPRRLLVTGRPIIKEDKAIAAVVIFKDITNRYKLRQAIVENEKRLKAILASLGEGVVVANNKGEFILFNKRAEEILGKGAMDIEPSQWTKKYHVYDPETGKEFAWKNLPLARALKGEASDDVEVLIKAPEYEEGRIISITGRPVKDESGNISAAVVDFRDITDYKHLEEVFAVIKDKYNFVLDEVDKF
ncbi:PAS domain-containing protein [Cytophagaceae bacterium ABcell3]|nr:PAS domain-containing protein [Cytophagaceae bacterium ABcell3]